MIGEDLDADKVKQGRRAQRAGTPGRVIFNPEDLKDVEDGFKLDDYRLSEEEYLRLAQDATMIRKDLRERAKSLALRDLPDSNDDHEAHAEQKALLDR